MIVHLFNSGLVSGPEKLVLPALGKLGEVKVIFLEETRLGEQGTRATEYARSLDLKVETVSVQSRFDRDAVASLLELLTADEEVIVHAHDVKATTYALWAKRASESPFQLLSTHHGVMGRPDWRSRCYELFYRSCVLPCCDRVFAVSRADFELLGHNPFLSSKLSLHLNGIEPPAEEIELTQYQARSVWKESQKGFYIGWVGRLSPEKRPSYMIEVAEQLNAMREFQNLPWKVLLFGEGELKRELEQAIVEKGLEQRVALKGFNSDIARQYRGFDIVCNTSSHEGLPIALLEAAFAERPLCISKTGGARDLIPAETFGLTVSAAASPAEFAGAISRLMKRPGLRNQLGKGIARRAKSRFSQERWLGELRSTYRELTPNSERIGVSVV